ncbi:CDP-diacylglycerol--glycerol-3-phosphate 3-phosphatidyltransferase [Motilibacter peucedani]|uniref:CDP-diacylglycerol--glycerol-3-phosphate 3-phosphatidyltransferase n=1 Tax=Motilibacter peucedani TaxID=598650 RepID=A0A420XRF2_9ACTN|nr:CDP-diacylglycerol--glycerol-3-phosphate 3-phosphatidyltransferase [Motilibacter peucedani]
MTGVVSGTAAAEPPGKLNIPNSLTVARLLLVPVMVVVLFHGDGHEAAWRWGAWAVFAVAGVTDLVDGNLARRRGSVTELGKLIDPIADKALIGASLVSLSILGDLPWVLTVVILVRELGVTLLRLWVIQHGVIAASRGGKVKTLLQSVSIGLFLLPHPGFFAVLAWTVMVFAVGTTLVTGGDYVMRAVRLRRTARP